VPITPAARKLILERLATNPARKKLLKKVGPEMEEILQTPGLRRAYLFGSIASNKPKPSDVDLLLRFKNPDAYQEALETAPAFLRRQLRGRPMGEDLHLFGASTLDLFKDMRKEGVKKYGSKHKWIRVLGAAGVIGAGTTIPLEEAEAVPRAKLYKQLLTSIIRTGKEDLPRTIRASKKAGIDTVDKRILSAEEIIKHTKHLKQELRGLPQEYFEGVNELRALTFEEVINNPRLMFAFGAADVKKGVIAVDPYNILDTAGVITHEILHTVFPSASEATIRSLTSQQLKNIGLVASNTKLRNMGIAAGLLSAKTIVSPEEAEAGVPKIKPETVKQLFGEVSSASKRLTGQTVRDKVVKEVRKGKGKGKGWRYIVFDDGTYMPLTKSQLQSHMAAKGQHKYVEKFRSASTEEKTRMLIKSLDQRFEQADKSRLSKSAIDNNLQGYIKKASEVDIDVSPDSVIIEYKGRRFSIPKAYAEILEGATKGRVRTIKKKPPKYDFGGAEYPEEGFTVVDIMPEKKFRVWEEEMEGEWERIANYIQQDIRKPFQLEPASEINLGAVLRYAGSKSGFTKGQEVPYKQLEKIANNIDRNLVPGGEVTIRDNWELIAPIIKHLKGRFEVIKKDMITPADGDLPAEWYVILKKAK
jgi:predicted nucleotidyltransferase